MHLYIKSFLISVFMSVTVIVPLLYSQQINSYVDEKGVTHITDQEIPAKYKKAARSVGYSTPATSAEKAAWEREKSSQNDAWEARKAKDEEDRLERKEAQQKADEEARKEQRLRQVEETAAAALNAASQAAFEANEAKYREARGIHY